MDPQTHAFLDQPRRWAVEHHLAASTRPPDRSRLPRQTAHAKRGAPQRRAPRSGARASPLNRPLGLRVDPRDRLVEHEELGLTGERAGDEGALLLAAGELRDRLHRRHRPVRPTRSRAPRRRDRHRAGCATSPGVAMRPVVTISRTVAGTSGRERRALRHVPDPPPVGSPRSEGCRGVGPSHEPRGARPGARGATSTSPSRSARRARRTLHGRRSGRPRRRSEWSRKRTRRRGPRRAARSPRDHEQPRATRSVSRLSCIRER